MIIFVMVMKRESSFTIKDWSENDRPREKLLSKGQQVLTDAELLAILIGSGNRNESAVALCQRILSSVDHNLNSLSKLTLTQLEEFKGIGQAKAISIIAAMELGMRRQSSEVITLNEVSSSKSVYQLMAPIIGRLAQEEFWVLYLNNANKVLYKTQISKGGITATLVDTRLVMKYALEQGATALILSHNHPSGNIKPSQSDIQLTNKLQVAATSLDLKILDHVIVAESNYYSFADSGLL